MTNKLLIMIAIAYTAVMGWVGYNTYYKKPANKDVVEVVVPDTPTPVTVAEAPKAEVIEVEEKQKPSISERVQDLFKKDEPSAPVVEQPAASEEKPSIVSKIFGKKQKEVIVDEEPEPVKEKKPGILSKFFPKNSKEVVVEESEPVVKKKPSYPVKKKYVEDNDDEPSYKSKPSKKIESVKKPSVNDHRDMNVFRQHGKDGEYRGGGAKTSSFSAPSFSGGSSNFNISMPKASAKDHRDMAVFGQHSNSR